MTLASNLYVAVGRVFLVLITLIAIRMFSYWYSFIFHWKRYRRLDPVTTSELHALGVPYVKVQITTKGSPGSTEVILRGSTTSRAWSSKTHSFITAFSPSKW